MTTKIIPVEAAVEEASAPTTRESVIGRQMNLYNIAAIIGGTAAATFGIQAWINAQVREEVTALRIEVKEQIGVLRVDMKDGLRDLKEEIKALKK